MMEENGLLVTNVFDGESLGALVKVDHRAAALFGDHLHRPIDGCMAFTRVCTEDIAYEAMSMHANQYGIFGGEAGWEFSHNQRNVRLAVHFALVSNHAEFAIASGNHRFTQSMHVALVLHAIADQLSD